MPFRQAFYDSHVCNSMVNRSIFEVVFPASQQIRSNCKPSVLDPPLMQNKNAELHLEHPFMGARMLRGQLAQRGHHVDRRHVRTLMLRMGIAALAPQPGTSQKASHYTQLQHHPVTC
jgi:hypothetical protein